MKPMGLCTYRGGLIKPQYRGGLAHRVSFTKLLYIEGLCTYRGALYTQRHILVFFPTDMGGVP